MKRILSIVCILACLVGVMATFSGCSMTKTALTASSFSEIVTAENNYEILDVTEEFADTPEVTGAVFAANDDIQIEFYLLDTADNASQLYSYNRQRAEESGSGSYAASSGKNYSTFSGTYDGQYYYLSQVDNTFIYIGVKESHKDAVKEIVKKLGY